MRKILPILFLFVYTGLQSQNVGIGTDKPLSKLHVAGDLRVDSLADHDSGVVIYNKSGLLIPLKLTGKKTDVLRGDGTFQPLAAVTATSPYWLTTGNSDTDPNLNFIGTSDAKSLVFKVENIVAGFIEAHGENTAFGSRTFYEMYRTKSSGFQNTAFGNSALSYNTTGSANVAVGRLALLRNTTGYGNVALGQATLVENLEGNRNTAVGNASMLWNTGSENTSVGAESLLSNTTGTFNTSSGFQSMYSNSTGRWNCAFGWSSMYSNVDGSGNIVFGSQALFRNKSGQNNTAVGHQALYSSSVSNQTALGYQSLYSNSSGVGNTGVGYGSLFSNTVGNYNSSNGFQSLYANISGSYNSSNGYKSLFLNRQGSKNTADGFKSLYSNSSGSNNTAQGDEALYNNTTGSNNTALGAFADVTSGNFINATAIGYNAKVNASNKVRIGNAAVTKIEGQVPFSTPSDGRYKFNVKEDVKGLSFIMHLRPVTYQFDVKKFDSRVSSDNVTNVAYDEAQAVRRTGFIAQEVEQAAAEANYNFNGVLKPKTDQEHYSLSYETFVVPLVKAVQEQQSTIQAQEKRIADLEKIVNVLLKSSK